LLCKIQSRNVTHKPENRAMHHTDAHAHSHARATQEGTPAGDGPFPPCRRGGRLVRRLQRCKCYGCGPRARQQRNGRDRSDIQRWRLGLSQKQREGSGSTRAKPLKPAAFKPIGASISNGPPSPDPRPRPRPAPPRQPPPAHPHPQPRPGDGDFWVFFVRLVLLSTPLK
jgi:hypothetical protein